MAETSLPAGWTADNSGACRSCEAPVLWATSDKTGKRAPFNLDGTSHFATCPQAGRWRRTRREHKTTRQEFVARLLGLFEPGPLRDRLMTFVDADLDAIEAEARAAAEAQLRECDDSYEVIEKAAYTAFHEQERAEAQVAELIDALSWALDLLDLTAQHLIDHGDPPERVHSFAYDTARAKAGSVLAATKETA